MPELLAAFRTGAGVPYASYGAGCGRGAGGPEPPRLRQRAGLRVDPPDPRRARRGSPTAATPTRVADVGCGVGWAAIELAKAYPHLRIDGYDTDEESISQARRNAADAGVADRVTFDVVDATGGYGDEPLRPGLVLRVRARHGPPGRRRSRRPRAALADGRDRDRHGRAGRARRSMSAIRSRRSSPPPACCGAYRRAGSSRTPRQSAR